ncbi:MAG: monovalent cation/H(+) antiporter subunit G [Actinomycetota bacterium]
MNVIGQALILVGSGLMLLAGVGAVRLPDLFSRLHAGAKAASLGSGCIFAGTAFLLPETAVTVKMLLAISFQFATAPVAAHVIGRAAYKSGIPMWRTLYNDLDPEEGEPELEG